MEGCPLKTVAFHTLGCKVNQYDTQAMLELFRAAGYTPVPFGGDADVYVLNTCTVTGTGDKKSLQLCRRIRRTHPDSQIVLCGCLAQRQGAALLDTGARLILGTQRRGEVVSLLEQAVSEGRQLCAVGPLPARMPYEELQVRDQEERTRAVMKIQEGCNNFCTYCIIPSVRGPIRSRFLEAIRREAGELAAAGFREIVLTGIHLTSYGRERKDGTGLLDAVRAVQETEGILRIRLGSLEPTVATPDFAGALAGMDKVCPHFHPALQSGSDTVLQRMRRRYTLAEYRQAAANLRAVWPDLALTTDVLTGFPGETEAEFEETAAFIREMGYARIHVFPYSPREGTPAAAMPGQLSPAEKEARARALIRVGNETAEAYRRRWLGREAQVLAEELERGRRVGYTPEYQQVSLPDCPGVRSGDLVTVRITALTPEGLEGEPV